MSTGRTSSRRGPWPPAAFVFCGVSHPSGCLRLGLADGSWALLAPSACAPTALAVAEAPTRGRRDALLAAAGSLARSPIV